MNLKEALLKAYADQEQTLPIQKSDDQKRVVLIEKKNKRTNYVVVTYGKSQGGRIKKPKLPLANSINISEKVLKKFSTNGKKDNSNKANKANNPTPAYFLESALIRKNPTPPVEAATPSATPLLSLRLDTNPKCLVGTSSHHVLQWINLNLDLGCQESIHQAVPLDTREMALGLDFGTSSVKVVIGDLGSDKAYAVPFFIENGIDAYLLPSRVYEVKFSNNNGQNSNFSLVDGENAFRDLKLGLLGKPDSVKQQVEVIAFLALVIQRARAWFFQNHQAIYKQVECRWKLRIGLPAASALDNKFVPLLENVLRAAWIVAALNTKPNRVLVTKVRDNIFDHHHPDSDLEVQVVPEIAAQIYGFVVSTSFNREAANRYLMIDIGAGTVDSSLFKVVPGRGGQWNFEFYTAVVQPYGISNLHTYRIDWWLSKLGGIDAAGSLMKQLNATKFRTDLGVDFPAQNCNYVHGVNFTKKDSPDQADSDFFDKNLMSQVQGSTLWRAWKDGFLEKAQLTKIPMFLCGGGSRSNFYLELESKLVRFPCYKWLSAEPWQLGFPSDLEADGVDQKDFDRLSVAYGLSKINVGNITQAVPLPKVPSDIQVSFTDRYVDKDQI